LAFAPGWTVTAEDATNRFEETICVRFVIAVPNTDREHAPEYKVPVAGGARSAWPIYVGDITDPAELIGRVLDAAVENVTHELRETARLAPTWWAPFHPHRADGIRRWSERTGRHPSADYLFGLS
jgi:hypothetical protein